MVTSEQEQGINSQELKRLRDSEIRYRRLFETAQDGILILDGETGQINDVNPFLMDMLGYSKEEFLGKRLWDTCPFKDAAFFIEGFRELQTQDYIRYEDLPLQTIAGERIQVEFVSNVYTVDHLKAIQCNIRDISQRKRTEVALRKERDLAQSYLNIAGSIIVIIEPDQKVLQVNDKGCQILGYSQNEIVGVNWFDHFVPERMRNEIRSGFVQLLAGNIKLPEFYENPVMTKDRGERTILWHNAVLRDETGHITGILTSGEDITERTRIERELRQANELLEAVTQGTEVIIAAQDTNFRYLFFNKAYEQEIRRLTGKDICVGASMVELFAHMPELQKIALEEWSQPLQGEYTDQILEFGDPGIYQRFYHILHTPLRNEGGDVIGAGEIARDITKRIQTEKANSQRIELREYALSHTLNELIQRAIDIGEQLTSSRIGFFHSFDTDQTIQRLQTWSTNTLENLGTIEEQGPHSLESQEDNWRNFVPERLPVIHNDCAILPQCWGFPEGHIQVERELIVPILQNDRVVAVLGVGNKPVDYNEVDVQAMIEFANIVWDLITDKHAKMQIEILARFPGENPYPVMRVDPTGRLLYANKASQLLLREWNCEVGQSLSQIWRDMVVEAYSIEKNIKTDVHCSDKIYSITFLPITDAGYVNLYGRDITEQVRATEALEKARDELEARVQERTKAFELANQQLQTEVVQRTRAEEALRSAFAYNRSLIEASLDPLVTITPDGKIGDVNHATELVTGASRDELIGTDFRSYFTDPLKARDGYQQVFELGVVRDFELEIRRKDGYITPVLYNASLFRDETGAAAGIFAAARDITQHKKAEQELQQQGALLQSMMENLPVGVWITDANGKILQGNPAGQRIWAGARYVGPELYGEYKGWWVSNGKPIAPDDWAAARAVKYGETSLNEEIEIECFDGSHKIILNSAIPLRDAQKANIGTIIVNQDISIRKQAEKELEDAKELLEKMFSSVDLLIAYLDKDFTFLRVNRAFAEADQHEPEFFIGTNYFDLFPNKEYEMAFRQVIQTGQAYTAYEMPFVYARNPERGVTYWDWSFQPVKDASGSIQGFVLSMADVTRRMKAEKAVEADRQRLLQLSQAERVQRLFTESLVRAMFALNSSLDLNEVLDRILEQIQMVLHFRAAYIALLEGGVVHIVRQRGFEDWPEVSDILSSSIPVEDFPIWKSLSSSRQVLLIPDTDGDPRWISTPGMERPRSFLAASLQPENSVVGFISVLSDQPDFFDQVASNHLSAFANQAELAIQNARLYSDLERLLDQEQSMRSQLVQSEKFAAMGRMLASVAHELNNPLQTIQNCLYLTQQDTPTGSPIQEYLDMSFSEIGRISKLVAQLRELYRPRSVMVIELKNIVEILDEAYSLLASHLQNQHVLWQQNPGPEILLVNCDADQIKQVFINIAMNAVEAMQPDGGSLTVQVVKSKDNCQAGILFRDTGPGIPSENHQILFDPFFTTKSSGLGLGLSICYELVQKHHGKITVESQVNEGSVFTVWLPLAENQDDTHS